MVASVTGNIMNHLPSGPFVTRSLSSGHLSKDSIADARDAIDRILAAAYEAGEWEAVRTLHAVSSLLAAVRH